MGSQQSRQAAHLPGGFRYFLALPAEIRLKVYSLALVEPQQIYPVDAALYMQTFTSFSGQLSTSFSHPLLLCLLVTDNRLSAAITEDGATGLTSLASACCESTNKLLLKRLRCFMPAIPLVS
jgi:hypothetical protein